MAITAEDVTLEEIIPISYDFSVVEGEKHTNTLIYTPFFSSPDELAVVGADTRVRVTFLEDELELRFPFGSHTRLFLSEVNRAWNDVCQQYPKEEPTFDWLTKYLTVSKKVRMPRKAIKATTSKMNQSKK
ncbi:hypothetical protein DNTS_005391, partial [Danionella cerebrum]